METVYILGAGFSAAAGAPLAREITHSLFSGYDPGNNLARVKDWLIKNSLDPNPVDLEHFTFEEIISWLDLKRYYHRHAGDPDTAAADDYEELLLKAFSDLLAPERLNQNPALYDRFVSLLTPTDTVITFNYDLVLENALHRTGKYSPDYRLRLRRPLNTPINPPSRTTQSLPLLKLHGSINLYFCPGCGEIYFFSNDFTERPLHPVTEGIALYCYGCQDLKHKQMLRHLVIAPTLFKSYSIAGLRELWFQALIALREATAIIFIGYSLPRADPLAFQLFDYSQRLRSSSAKVMLVNGPEADHSQHQKIYGNHLFNTKLDFATWVTMH